MKKWNKLKERFLQDILQTRLGNLASNLTRVKSRCHNIANQDLVHRLLQESKLFIEWTAQDAEVEVAAELVDLQVQLARWQYHWGEIWQDEIQRSKVADTAKNWSDKVLKMAGLI